MPFSDMRTINALAETFAPPAGQVSIGDAQDEGTSSDTVRADHIHAVPAAAAGQGATASAPGDTEADGVATTPARSDHRHAREAAAALAAPTNPVLGTVYQNTTGAPLAVTVALALAPGTTGPLSASLGVGPTNTPAAVVVAELAASSPAITVPLTFIVPDGGYYQLTATLNGGTASAAVVSGATL